MYTVLVERAPSFRTSSPQARAIADLFGQTLLVCGVIFLLVVVLVTIAIVRFRDRGGAPPTQIEGHTKLELAWTAAPLLVLAWLFFLTTRAMGASDAPTDRAPDLVVTGHQWWWEIRYASGAVTANEIHIPVGRPLVIGVESADVVHDFWVPELARKIDAIPGRNAHIWMQADTPGTYLGACAEYCGAQHAWMRIVVIAQTPEDFAAWEEKTRMTASPPTTESATRGARSFEAMTCVRCHAIGGTGQDARVAPDLTHFASRTTLGAGVLPNTPSDLARWLKDPQAIKPGCHMPDVKLTDAQVADFVAYFETLR